MPVSKWPHILVWRHFIYISPQDFLKAAGSCHWRHLLFSWRKAGFISDGVTGGGRDGGVGGGGANLCEWCVISDAQQLRNIQKQLFFIEGIFCLRCN